MGRTFEELDCGCFISCEGGGGLIPCGKPESECKAGKYMNGHARCKKCGLCRSCECMCEKPKCPECGKNLDWCPSGHYVCFECGWQAEGCDYPSPDDVSTKVTYVGKEESK